MELVVDNPDPVKLVGCCILRVEFGLKNGWFNGDDAML